MKKKYGGLTIDAIIVILFAAYYILPSMSMKYNFTLILLAGFLYVFVTALQNGMQLSRKVVNFIFIIAFIALMYLLLTDTSSISAEASSRGLKRFLSKFYQLGMMYLPVLMLTQISMRSSSVEKKALLLWSFGLISYVTLTTMRELIINPNITRAWSGFAEASMNNIANYYFVYAIPFVIVLAVYCSLNTERLYIKIAMILVSIYLMYFLFLSQYTLSVLITIVGIAMEVYNHASLGKNRTAVVMILVILAISSPWIIKIAAANVPSEQMSKRFYEIYYFLVGGDTTGYNLNGRMTLYLETIKAFFRSPVWGNSVLDVDGHATLLTVLANTGLLGGVPFYYCIFAGKKATASCMGELGKEFTPFFVMLMLMGFTNPIHSALPLMYVVWFVVPLTISVLEENKGAYYGELEN